MKKKRKWLSVSGFLAIAAAAAMLSAYAGASSSQGGIGPTQPIAFPHTVHAGTLKMNCVYCHFSATKSPDPGLPAVGTCMGCHMVVSPAKPGATLLAGYWNRKQPVPWVRIHKLPEYVHFPHMRHVNAGVSCQTCHGAIQNMKQVYQQNSLNMGWCINCHVGRSNPPFKARYDCATCHY
ncbi:MAG TPA: cytochrome c3 family protein [Gemmatimonadaceae bacterium]|nr:cytochrome c3 family protein [Gemmatimonadaceae bacterium]